MSIIAQKRKIASSNFEASNTHLGRISGALNSTVGITSLFGVLGISGVLGEVLGIVPVLNIAAGITMLTGLVVLLFLPANA